MTLLSTIVLNLITNPQCSASTKDTLGDDNCFCWKKFYHIKEAFHIYPIKHEAVVCSVMGSICLINASPALCCFGVHLLIATLALNNTYRYKESWGNKITWTLAHCLCTWFFSCHLTNLADDPQTPVQSIGGAGELLLWFENVLVAWWSFQNIRQWLSCSVML